MKLDRIRVKTSVVVAFEVEVDCAYDRHTQVVDLEQRCIDRAKEHLRDRLGASFSIRSVDAQAISITQAPEQKVAT